ncbi:MAG: bifunctional phosphoribosylaminoimidazolecarboxamide formyltransferase/IMP cyclohydrolase [Bacteroidetes bacterium]|nr:bifunctional phosphoribosylaminoimidazolecarboxamide formyltransferase/IMP cyclohydrolase [Bacteroidota bacterium]
MNKYALISVSDKEGIVEFAKGLKAKGFEILATGNSAKLLIENNIGCIKIEDYTSFPEIFSGRVKTLQPQIFGGILMRRDNDSDIKEAIANNIKAIDVVCVNLYPFPKVVNRDDIDLNTKIENIDIGGPSLIRAAAKNYKYVSILTNPNQYNNFLSELEQGDVTSQTRESLASEAFAHTAYYDTLIANYFEKEFNQPQSAIRINHSLQGELRYGENPHQKAYLYGDFYKNFEVLHGKELSYNNIIDFSAAVELILDLEPNSCAIIKHTNPCGAAKGSTVLEAYEKALSCDPVSAFGGIVAFNTPIDAMTAEKLNEIFLEIICAPEFSDDVLEILKKKKNRRIVKINYQPSLSDLQYRNIPGGTIAQSRDNSNLAELELKTVTERDYTQSELNDLKFAWVICKHTKSNAIVYIKDEKTIGVGAGQMSRIDSARIAASKAKEQGHDLTGAVAASDAFFPFPDGVIEIAKNGITAIIQPGGSVRDEEVIEAANAHKLAMVFTGTRNFKH